MKNCKNIIKNLGEGLTPGEIKEEITHLEDENLKSMEKIKNLTESLNIANRDLLAGEGSKKTVTALKRKIEALQEKVGVFKGIITDLEQIAVDAAKRPIEARITIIDKELKNCESSLGEQQNKLIELFSNTCSLFESVTGLNYRHLSWMFFCSHPRYEPKIKETLQLNKIEKPLYSTMKALENEKKSLERRLDKWN